VIRDATRPVRALPIALVLAFSLVACSAAERSPSPRPSPAEPSAAASAVSGPFVLSVILPRTTWSANEPIDLKASLVYHGDQRTLTLAGSGSGLVGFGLKELTGRREVVGAQTSDCVQYQVDRGAPMQRAYVKSGALSDNDPDKDWVRRFLDDKLFRLPAGRWRVTAYANFFEGTCDSNSTRHEIHVSVDLTVS
jgi:hypothetical protein